MNGPISHKILCLRSSGTSAGDLVDESPKWTADTNPTKGLDRHGLDRTGLERIHDTSPKLFLARKVRVECTSQARCYARMHMVCNDTVSVIDKLDNLVFSK